MCHGQRRVACVFLPTVVLKFYRIKKCDFRNFRVNEQLLWLRNSVAIACMCACVVSMFYMCADSLCD